MNELHIRSGKRRIASARCGEVFTCGLDGACWCAVEPYRMPMTSPATEDCLCPECLRRAAAALETARQAAR